MARCAAIKGSGDRCAAQAMTGYDHCYVHAPELTQERQRSNRRGGLAGGRGRPKESEMAQLKREAAVLYTRVLEGEVSPSVGAVAVQSLNLRARLWEAERRARLAESEIVTQEQLRDEARRAAEVIQRHVDDPEVLKAIGTDLHLEDEARNFC